MKKYLSIAAIIVIIIIGWVVVKKDTVQTSGEAIKVGVSLPLSGPVAQLGEWSLQGMKTAVEEINQSGGVKGRPLELIAEDDKCDGKMGTDAVTKLLNIDQTKAMVVYCGSVIGVIPQVVDGKALVISTSVRTEPLEGKYPFIFNLTPSALKESEALAKKMYDDGVRKVAFFHQADFYGQTYFNKFKQTWESLGGTITIEGVQQNLQAPDFRTDLTKAKQVGTDAIVTSFNAPQYAVILKQAKELGLTAKFYSYWNTENQVLLSAAGELANNIIYTYSFKEQNNSGYNKFKQNYQEKYQKDPEDNAAKGYDAVMLIAQAIEVCGESDVPCMISEIQKIKSYQGVSGTFNFKDNIADKAFYLKKIVDQKFTFMNE